MTNPKQTPPLERRLTPQKNRARSLRDLFKEQNPKLPCPLPEHILAVVTHGPKIRLICLNPLPLQKNLLRLGIPHTVGTQQTLLLNQTTPHKTLAEAGETLFEAILWPSETQLLSKIPLPENLIPTKSHHIALHSMAQTLEAQTLDEHPTWLLKKGSVHTLHYNPQTKTTEPIKVGELPSSCQTRLERFPLLIKRGGNRITLLLETHTGRVLQKTLSGTPLGQQILRESRNEIQRLGDLGIPTWIA